MFTNLIGKSNVYVLGTILNTCDDFDIKVDPNSDFSYDNNCTRVTIDNMNANIAAYVGKTFAAGYFGTSFSIQWDAAKTSGGDKARDIMLALSNNPICTLATLDADNEGIAVYYGINLSQTYVRLYEYSGNNNDIWYRGAYPVAQNWYELTRLDSNIVLRTYDDVDRTSLIQTQSITGNATDTYKYIHIVGSNNTTAETDPHAGWQQNYNIVELTQRYAYDRQPFQNPLRLADVGYGSSTRDPAIFSGGTLYVRNAADDEVSECVLMTSVVDNIAGTAAPGGTFAYGVGTHKGDNLAVGFGLGNGAFDMKWIEYSGDDLTTETKNLDLDSSWTQALFPLVRGMEYNSTTGQIIGLVTATSSGTPKNWLVKWNYTTGAVEPGGDTIYQMTTTDSLKYIVFDPDSPGSYMWCWRESDEKLLKYSLTDGTYQNESMDFSAIVGAAYGVTTDPNGNLCILTHDASTGALLHLFEGFTTTLRSF